MFTKRAIEFLLKLNETPRCKQRGIYFASKIYSVTSHGEFNPRTRLNHHFAYLLAMSSLADEQSLANQPSQMPLALQNVTIFNIDHTRFSRIIGIYFKSPKLY